MKKYWHWVKKTLGWIVKTVFYMSIWTYWGEVFFGKRFFSFSDCKRKYSAICQNFSSGVVKTAFNVSAETFWRKVFFPEKKNIFVSISELERKVLNSLPGNWRRGCQNFIWIGHMKKLKDALLGIFLNIFGLWAKKCSAFCRKNSGCFVKTAFNVSAGTIWGKHFFRRRNFFNLGHSGNDFGLFVEKFTAGVSKLRFTCP